ncbi:MAG: hypothetical protein GY830_06275 [Bacteroidetes bacterium]|nr:hypothetical protein [Bacteroidota bacterium]
MSFLIQIILTITFSYLLETFCPWWSIAISSFIIPLFINSKASKVFLGGFAAISSLWMTYAAIIDVQTNSIISSKVAPLFGFSNSIFLVLITGLVGGLVGGFSALTGFYFKSLFIQSIKDKNELGYLND